MPKSGISSQIKFCGKSMIFSKELDKGSNNPRGKTLKDMEKKTGSILKSLTLLSVSLQCFLYQ